MEKHIVCERIKALRHDLNISQKEFAGNIGITQPTLSCYEKGSSLPSIDILTRIAVVFGVSIDWLCGIEKNPSSVSTISDFAYTLFELDKKENLRFEIEIEKPPVSEMNKGDHRWKASIKFDPYDPAYPLNLQFCRLLYDFKDNRWAYEHYMVRKEQYDWWQEFSLKKYSDSFLINKQYEDIPEDQRIARRNAMVIEDIERSKKTSGK